MFKQYTPPSGGNGFPGKALNVVIEGDDIDGYRNMVMQIIGGAVRQFVASVRQSQSISGQQQVSALRQVGDTRLRFVYNNGQSTLYITPGPRLKKLAREFSTFEVTPVYAVDVLSYGAEYNAVPNPPRPAAAPPETVEVRALIWPPVDVVAADFGEYDLFNEPFRTDSGVITLKEWWTSEWLYRDYNYYTETGFHEVTSNYWGDGGFGWTPAYAHVLGYSAWDQTPMSNVYGQDQSYHYTAIDKIPLQLFHTNLRLAYYSEPPTHIALDPRNPERPPSYTVTLGATTFRSSGTRIARFLFNISAAEYDVYAKDEARLERVSAGMVDAVTTDGTTYATLTGTALMELFRLVFAADSNTNWSYPVTLFAYYGAEDFYEKTHTLVDVVETKLRLDPRRFFGVQLVPSETAPSFWEILHMNHVVYHIGYRTRGGMFLPIQRPNALFFWGYLTLPAIPIFDNGTGFNPSAIDVEYPICSAMLPSVTDLEEMERVAAIAKAEARANVAALAQVNIVFPVAGAQTPPKGAPTLDPTNT